MNTSIEQRVEALERSNRRMKRIACGAVLAAVGIGIMGQTSGPVVQPPILTRGIKIVDAQGRKRAELVCNANVPAMRLFGADGTEQVSLYPSVLQLSHQAGPFARYSFNRVTFNADAQRENFFLDHKSLIMRDGFDPRISLRFNESPANPLGYSVLRLYHSNGFSFRAYTSDRTYISPIPFLDDSGDFGDPEDGGAE